MSRRARARIKARESARRKLFPAYAREYVEGYMTNYEYVVLFEDQLVKCPGLRYIDEDAIMRYLDSKWDAAFGRIYSRHYSWKVV